MSTRRALIVHAILYVALFGGLVFGLSRQQASVNTQRKATFHTCERNRVVRAYLRVNAPPARRAEADRLMPLVDCERAVDDGNEPLLSPTAVDEFLLLVARGVRPVVRDGRVEAPAR